MDIDALINEIYSKVQERILERENAQSDAEDKEKPKLLILADAHGDICHQALECPRLGRYYQTECALLQDCRCDMADYEAVIAYTLSNESLGKIASGIFDSDYSRLFGQALLMGKKIFVPKEEIELYRYQKTAPKLYYQRLEEHLKLLMASGVVILPNSQLSEAVLGGAVPPAEEQVRPEPEQLCEEPCSRETEFVISKRVITERDMIAAKEAKAYCIVIDRKAILTDLAKEFAGKQNMKIQRGFLDQSGKGHVV